MINSEILRPRAQELIHPRKLLLRDRQVAQPLLHLQIHLNPPFSQIIVRPLSILQMQRLILIPVPQKHGHRILSFHIRVFPVNGCLVLTMEADNAP